MDRKGKEGGLKRRPLCGLCFLFVLGTGGGLFLPLGWWLPAGVAVGLLLAGLLFHRHAWSSLPVLVLVVLVAALHAQLSGHSPSGRALERQLVRPSEFVLLAGRVVDEPVADGPHEQPTAETTFLLEVEGINRLGGWQRAEGRVRVRWRRDADEPPLCYGDRWALSGVLDRTHRTAFTARGDTALLLSRGGGFRPMAWCLRARRACRRILGMGLEAFPDHAGLLRALMLGYGEELSAPLRKDFSATGTLHIFAISGTHVGVMAVLFTLLLRMAGVSRAYWAFVVVPLLMAYTLATGMAASAVRACIMAVVFMAGDFLARKSDGWSSLALAALIILVFSPEQLRDLGFILSFSAVAGLMALYGPVHAAVSRPLAPDPWQPADGAVRPFARDWSGRLRPITALAAASCAAWIATAPLSAYYFNLFSPVALAANLAVIPGAFVIMLTGGLAILTGWMHAAPAEAFNHANRLFITLLLKVIDLAGAVPGGHLFVRMPPIWLVAGWYGSLLAFPVLRILPRRNLAVGVGLCLCLAGGWRLADRRRAHLDVLDVGQGNAALLNVPGSGDVLLDTGGRSYAFRVARFLRREGVNRLAALVVSHADAEHMGAGMRLLEELPVDRIIAPVADARSRVFKAFRQRADERGIPFDVARAGDRFAFAGGVELEVLYPPAHHHGQTADEACLVARVTRGGCSVLLMADAGRDVEEALLNSPVNPCASVLIVGRHGHESATSAAWLEAVRPTTAVISVGADNQEGLPAKAVTDRLRERQVNGWRTDEQGSCRIELTGAGVSVRAAD